MKTPPQKPSKKEKKRALLFWILFFLVVFAFLAVSLWAITSGVGVSENALALYGNETQNIGGADMWQYVELDWPVAASTTACWQHTTGQVTLTSLCDQSARFTLAIHAQDLVSETCVDPFFCAQDQDCMCPNEYCKFTNVGMHCALCANLGQTCQVINFAPCCDAGLMCTGNVCVPVPTSAPTVAPTNQPTTQPTQAPTRQPTVSPTTQPTLAPTRQPTVSPTTQPTLAPTRQPTVSPTTQPTLAPTRQPTVSPTTSPTNSPTNSPTTQPTVSPTVSPTSSPTNSPTTPPTVSPTGEPTNPPTNQPTQAPTVSPTQAPTVQPTVAPTSQPTISPTTAPTSQPTTAPTAAPTTTPTTAPTANPTSAPTRQPTAAPTNAPTSQPTGAPTNQPTALPTSAPTTAAPTMEPSPCDMTQVYTRLMKQAGGVGPFVPVMSLTTYTLNSFISTTFTYPAAQGDVFGFQWTSNCGSTALTPVSFDLRFIGRVTPPFLVNVSSYATVTTL